jgi:hypothetical protein
MHKEINNLKNWVKKNNKYLMPVSLVLGFIVDSMTLSRVDRAFENIIFIAYLFLAILGIFFFNYLQNKEIKNYFLEKVYIFSPYIIQFMFGGLFSGFAVFYLRSGSISSSWFFILILLLLMVGNDIFKKKYENFVLQMTIFFAGLFFYNIFAVPIIANSISVLVFIISGVVSILILLFLLYIFSIFLPEQIKRNTKNIFISIFSVFAFINILYFTNIIPPIPLSLKVGNVYHHVSKENDGYHTLGEAKEGIWNFSNVVHIQKGNPIYAYSAVFAPLDINTNIVHNWQYFDPIKKNWRTESRITFPISGGNLKGYRGYSYKSNLYEGDWRVLVETTRGQVIGKISFTVLYTEFIPVLEEKVL